MTVHHVFQLFDFVSFPPNTEVPNNFYKTSILKGSDDGVLQSGSLSFWTL
jgi:hypothetical protein